MGGGARSRTESGLSDEGLLRGDDLLAHAVRLARVGCWSYDLTERRIDVNDELRRMLGLDRAPRSAAGFLDLVHPDDRSRVAALIAEAAARPRQVSTRLRVVRGDGAVRDCHVVAELDPGDRPGRARWIGSVQDVSDQADAERAREAAEERARRILLEIPVAVVAVDENGVFREWNQEAERITGYTREEIVDNPRGLTILYDEQELARVASIWPKSTQQDLRDHRFTIRRNDGERRTISWSALASARSVTGIVRTAMGIDVTEAERESQRYRALAHHLPGGAVLLYDRDLRYLLVDGSDLGAVGGDRLRMVGRTVFEAAAPELAARLAPSFREALEGRIARCEIAQDGSFYEVTCVPVRELGGPIEAGMALTQNISGRKQAENELRDQRERLARVLELIPALVVGLDARGRTIFANPAAERTTGYTAAELFGRSWWDTLCPGDERRHVEEMMAAVDAFGSLGNYEMVVRTKDGEERTVSWSGERAPLSRGLPGEVYFYGLDVTERNQMQERLVIAERMASLGTLAAGVAHEINNPLSYVLANLTLAGEAVESGAAGGDGDAGGAAAADELRSILAEAHQGAARVARIVADLRMFSRSHEDRTELIDVGRSIETCLSMAANELRHRARVVRDLRPVPAVRANEARLSQVFLNLIVNAAHALPETSPNDNEVCISTAVDERGRVVVAVADNGCGMAPSTVRRIFDPFFTTKPVGVGTGLGLAIAHRIVTGFGGEILVDTEQGRGSVFRVVLSAAEPGPGEEPTAPRRVPVSQRGRILVIDDEAFVAYAIRRALERAHAVTVAASAAEGLAALSAHPFDVILCDVMLPDVSGIDLYAQVSVEHPEQARRMIFITGGAFTNRARDFLDSVPNACLDKPFEPPELLSLINERLSRWGPAG